MKDSIDVKALWHKQVVPTANHSEVFKRIRDFKKGRIKKIIILNVVLLLTVCFVVFIWMYFKPQLISTKIGIVLTVLSIILVVVFNRKLVHLYRKINDNQSNSDYLNALFTIRNKESFIQTKIMNLYFILLSLGISLYMYEYILAKSQLFGLLAYFVLFLWVGFNWFFLRPRIIRSNRRKLDSLLQKIENVKSQLKES